MIEGIKRHGDLVWRSPSMAGLFVGTDFLSPLQDSFFSFAFVPVVVLALTGRFYIAEPMTLLVLPITLLIVMVMFRKEKQVFK